MIKKKLTTILEKFNLSSQKLPTNDLDWSNFLDLLESDIDEIITNTITRSETNYKKFITLFEASPLPYMFFDETGIVDCNEATIKILGGQNKNDIISRHPAEYSPEYQPDGKTSKDKSVEMDHLARKNGIHTFEWIHKTLQGKEFPVEVSLSHVNLNDKPILLVIWRDLTDLKIKDQMLIHSAKMSSLGEMAGGIAHEVNNPLAIINGTASLLVKKIDAGTFDPTKGKAQLNNILNMTERITKIVKGLKSFSRNAELDPYSLISVRSIIDNALSLCTEKFKHLNVQIKTELENELDVECRNTQIEQVLLNLLNNSHDAILNLSEKWIQVTAKEIKDQVQISVTDSGLGIPLEIVTKMMQPFYTTKDVGFGTGLGLSISKGIIENHSGTLTYDPQSKNTRFVISIPKRQNINSQN